MLFDQRLLVVNSLLLPAFHADAIGSKSKGTRPSTCRLITHVAGTVGFCPLAFVTVLLPKGTLVLFGSLGFVILHLTETSNHLHQIVLEAPARLLHLTERSLRRAPPESCELDVSRCYRQLKRRANPLPLRPAFAAPRPPSQRENRQTSTSKSLIGDSVKRKSAQGINPEN